MLLSSIKDLPYVDPAAVYSLPVFMTDEEFEEMQEENEQIASNALISSIIYRLKWMSRGPFII